MLNATAAKDRLAASVAEICGDLLVRVFAGADNPLKCQRARVHPVAPDQMAPLSVIMLCYFHTDRQTAAPIAKRSKHSDASQVELLVKTNRDGRRYPTAPQFGTAAWARSDLIRRAAFGVLVGATLGAFGARILDGGVVTGIASGIFGLVMGALYGVFASRGIAARRLVGIRPLLAPGTSILLVCADGLADQQTTDTLTAPDSRELVLRFNPIGNGVVMTAL